MRGIPSLITDIRKKVFTEVARMAYSGDYPLRLPRLPDEAVPRDGAVSGLPCLLMSARVPEGRRQIRQRQEPH